MIECNTKEEQKIGINEVKETIEHNCHTRGFFNKGRNRIEQVKGYNLIAVFNKTEDKLLMCIRKKNPYKNLATHSCKNSN